MLFGVSVYSKGTKDFNNALQFIKSHNKQLCKSEVGLNYIRSYSFGKADLVFIAEPNTITRSRKTVGFALVQVHNSHYYIDVICANGSGKALLNAVEVHARRNDKQFLKLSALPAAVLVYKKMGFVHTDGDCTEEPTVSYLSSLLKGKRFSSSQSASKNEEFKQLLKHLIKLKLTSNKGCKTVKKCSVDGFTMTKCLF